MVRKRSTWAVGSDQYVKKANRGAHGGESPDLPLPAATGADEERHELQIGDTGVCWGEVDYSPISKSGLDRARRRFRSSLPDLIWNTAKLEGNNFTLPEVKTLLDGVTVGGQKTEDEQQILALGEAYNALDAMLRDGAFAPTKEVSDRLHTMVAIHEAIESGHFRGEGQVTGGGAVNLSDGGSVPGLEHGPGGADLRERFDRLSEHLGELEDPRERALVYFASATRSHFYFDGNKRTARLMMTGMLISHGYESVNIPYARRLEFNDALDGLFADDDATELLRFLATCAE
ncbi:MAG: Fic family protein [Aeromicrobium sp.]|uniref:Fic family protein n=1 Tax=Aeromicrobium sp. TaxID=1871063 RepID=UPI0039E5361D